jgi:hypothetical protein
MWQHVMLPRVNSTLYRPPPIFLLRHVKQWQPRTSSLFLGIGHIISTQYRSSAWLSMDQWHSPRARRYEGSASLGFIGIQLLQFPRPAALGEFMILSDWQSTQSWTWTRIWHKALTPFHHIEFMVTGLWNSSRNSSIWMQHVDLSVL